MLGTHLYLSTVYYPQSDGQTERMNRLLEETLRHYISPTHDDWDAHLPLIEFAVNNSFQRSIGTTPFLLNGVRQPRTPADLNLPSHVPAAAAFEACMKHRLTRAKQCLASAQDRQKADADGHRKPVTFHEGHKVLLSTRNLQMKGPGTKKLFPRWTGPFTISKMVGANAERLDLPSAMRIHPVFHVSLLKPYRGDGPVQPPPPIEVDGDKYFAVEAIIDHRDFKRGRTTRREYLVRWVGYGPEHNTFEPGETLREQELLRSELDAYDAALVLRRTQPVAVVLPAPLGQTPPAPPPTGPPPRISGRRRTQQAGVQAPPPSKRSRRLKARRV